MAECSYKSGVSPYHDGELDADGMDAFELHLQSCRECAAELERARALSRLLSSVPPQEMSANELAGVHDAVDEVASRGLFRFAMGLSAVAASILIISAAWLYDGAAAPGRSAVNQATASEQPWERWASTGRIELPARARETGVAERDTAEWMAVSLGVSPSHESR